MIPKDVVHEPYSSSHSRNDRVKKFHHKVRSGCAFCRKRRMKCDETKPICRPCARRGLHCVYDRSPSGEVRQSYSHPPLGRDDRYHAKSDLTSTHTLPSTSEHEQFFYVIDFAELASFGNLNTMQGQTEEKRHLAFFLSQTHARFASRGGIGTQEHIALVYLTLAPQIAQSSSAVRSAISATSAAEENMMRHGNISDCLIAQQQHHFRFTLRAIMLGNLPLEELLICCAMLFSLSCFTRNYTAAKLHLESGLRMVEEQQQRSNLPMLSIVGKALHDLRKTLTYIFPGHNVADSPAGRIVPFQDEDGAYQSLRAVIQTMAQDEFDNVQMRLASWKDRFEVSEAKFNVHRARRLSSLYNTTSFVLRLVTTPIDTVVTGTRLFAIENQFKHTLSQGGPDPTEDVTVLQRMVRDYIRLNADASVLSHVPTFLLMV